MEIVHDSDPSVRHRDHHLIGVVIDFDGTSAAARRQATKLVLETIDTAVLFAERRAQERYGIRMQVHVDR